jgi:hypothetical protein
LFRDIEDAKGAYHAVDGAKGASGGEDLKGTSLEAESAGGAKQAPVGDKGTQTGGTVPHAAGMEKAIE